MFGIFDRLEARQSAEEIDAAIDVPERTTQRFAQLKRHLETAGRDAPWPSGLKKSWSRTIDLYASWYQLWADARDDPGPAARRDHVKVLVAFARDVNTQMRAFSWTHLLIDPGLWPTPFVPKKLAESPEYPFEQKLEFKDLVAHMPSLARWLDAVRKCLVHCRTRFEKLTELAGDAAAERLPELAGLDQRHAVRDAVIADAINQANVAEARPAEVVIETDRDSGQTTIRAVGRAASGIPYRVAERVRHQFPALVLLVMRSIVMAEFRSSQERLLVTLEKAREPVGSDDAARFAIVRGTCGRCRTSEEVRFSR